MFLVIVTTSAGCGGMPASVAGTVSLDDKPLTVGKVSFTPVGGGRLAFGTIHSDGSYELSTNAAAGLVPGDYEVAVVAREMIEQGDGPPMQGQYLAPKRYANAKTSGLRFAVEPGRNNIPIALSSAEAELNER